MRDEIKSLGKPLKKECGIFNLNTSDQMGSHWVAWVKRDDYKEYFDSFGNSPPPLELVEYLGSDNVFYNYDSYQNYNDPPICGYLCVKFLLKFFSNKWKIFLQNMIMTL